MARKKDWNLILQEKHDNYSYAREFSNSYPIYIGRYIMGSNTTNTPAAEPIWQIKKLVFDASNNPVNEKWPLDETNTTDDSFSYVWNDRASLSYI